MLRAAEMLDLFAYRIAREAGSLIAALGGLGLFVFTAGIGEHSALVRCKACAQLGFAGLLLDAARKVAGATIGSEASAVAVHVIPTNEEQPIAEAMGRLVGAGTVGHPLIPL